MDVAADCWTHCARRRFNFTPMILGMLRVLADGGKLEPLLDAGKQAKAKKREERQKQQQSKN